MAKTADDFRAEIMRDIERLKVQRRLLDRTHDVIEDEIEELVSISLRLSEDTLPTADAPPLLVAIMRAELARAMFHLKRAGKGARRMGLDVAKLAAALEAVKAFSKSLPKDMPKTYRRLP